MGSRRGPLPAPVRAKAARSSAATYKAAAEIPSIPDEFLEYAEDLTAGNWGFYSTGARTGIVGLWVCIDAQGWERSHKEAVTGKARSTSQMLRRQLIKEKSADCSTFAHLRLELIGRDNP